MKNNKKLSNPVWQLFISVKLTAVLLCLGLVAPVYANIKPSSETVLPKEKIQTLNLEKYRVDRKTISPGQTLSTIMWESGVNRDQISTALKKAQAFIDVNQIEAGQQYVVVKEPEYPFLLKYFLYEVNLENSVVFEFDEFIKIFWGKEKFVKYNQAISGKVNSSLWKSLKAKNVSTDIIFEFMSLFDNRLNFQKLRPGTSFRIVFEGYGYENRIIKPGKILFAELKSGGSKYTAYRFDHHGIVSYYDENGNNLQSVFLKSPVKSKQITSAFSLERRHPITQKVKQHPGIDFGARSGTPVMSVGDGVVEKKEYSPSAGNHIKISHPDDIFASYYLHLESISKDLQVGSKVKKGQIIGKVGSTGKVTGPHLDFRFSKQGQLVDYFNVSLPDGQPIDDDCKQKFQTGMKQMLSKINKKDIPVIKAG